MTSPIGRYDIAYPVSEVRERHTLTLPTIYEVDEKETKQVKGDNDESEQK